MKGLKIIALIIVAITAGYYLFGRSGYEKAGTTQQVPAPGSPDIAEMVVEGGVVAEEEQPSGVREIVVEGKNYEFTPNALTLKAGERVSLTFTSKQGLHDFVIEGLDIATSRANTGRSDTVEFTAPSEPGTYTFYCSVGNHRALGMEGVLTIE